MSNDFIGITEDRLHHILGVARKCYQIAKERGKDEEFCRKMFMLGWCHDVGYEFSETQEEHPDISFDLVNLLYDSVFKGEYSDEAHAIREHGRYNFKYTNTDEMWEILNTADMTVNSKGEAVTVTERLKDIERRYGSMSEQYQTACTIALKINENRDGKENT